MRLLVLLAAFLLLGGCSKDNQLANSNYMARDKNTSEVPIFNYGSIKGIMEPVPIMASVKVFNENGFSTSGTVYANGTFNIENLPGDVYTVQIAYLIQNGEYRFWNYFDVPRVSVKGGEVTSLDVIRLPWSY